MKPLLRFADQQFDHWFTPLRMRQAELAVLRISVIAFLAHILIIFFGHLYDPVSVSPHHYLKAIFTPFSFILYYEVFLLVVIIPKSISEFIGKQFEVITLITLRSFFHDIADIDFRLTISITHPEILGLLYDLVAALLMLVITILYYKLYKKSEWSEPPKGLTDFISIKKLVSLAMIMILIILSCLSFYQWGNEMIHAIEAKTSYPDPNRVFYAEFFTIMIFVDVLLLIISFMYHFTFFSVFRNASFVITTILIRISLGLEKPQNYFIILIGFLFSLLSYYLYRFRPKEK
ncbi:MAG: hypothetical protein RL732_1263 [Bacteroidota bacterium]